jgi:transposase
MLNVRILISKETVNDLVQALQRAYKAGDAKLVRRITALVSLSQGEKVKEIAATLGVSPSSVYEWLKQLMVEGVAGLKPCWKGGRPAKLTPSQRQQLAELIDAGPQAAGFRSACWNSVMIQEVIQREFGRLYNVHYVSELLKNLGFSFQKARFISGHLDEERRRTWLAQTWPQILQQARAVHGLILFGDEASFAQWGSLGYTWARRGQQPLVPTSGKRRAYKVFGLIEFFSGQFFYQGITDKFNSDSYIVFLTQVLEQTAAPLFLVQDGARYHTSKTTRHFFALHTDRLTVFQLPSYSPDYNPIEFLWRNVKREATHLKYFPTFEALLSSVDETLTDFQTQADQVKGLFGRYLDLMAEALPVAAYFDTFSEKL